MPWGYRQLRAAALSVPQGQEHSQGSSAALSGTAWHCRAESAQPESLPCRGHACTSQETERFLSKGSSEPPWESPSRDPCWHTCTEKCCISAASQAWLHVRWKTLPLQWEISGWDSTFFSCRSLCHCKTKQQHPKPC